MSLKFQENYLDFFCHCYNLFWNSIQESYEEVKALRLLYWQFHKFYDRTQRHLEVIPSLSLVISHSCWTEPPQFSPRKLVATFLKFSKKISHIFLRNSCKWLYLTQIFQFDSVFTSDNGSQYKSYYWLSDYQKRCQTIGFSSCFW